jgi:hypothetical protein
MTDIPGNPEEKLDKAVEKILASDAARRAALNSKNVVLQSAARLSSDSARPQLSTAAKAAMLQQVLDAMPQSVTTAPKVKISEHIMRPTFLTTIAKAAAGFIAVLLLAGLVTVPASANSLPGDVLYPVKRGYENVQFALTRSPETQAALQLTHAQTRMDELQQLVLRGEYEETLIVASLDSLSASITVAQDNNLYDENPALVEATDATFATIAATMNSVEAMDSFDVVEWEAAYNVVGQQYNNVGNFNIPGDFGCGRPGNACNAPSHSNANGNANGQGNSNANGNSNGNANGNSNGRGNGNANGNANGNGNGRGGR